MLFTAVSAVSAVLVVFIVFGSFWLYAEKTGKNKQNCLK
jgi:hypothetical protein